MLSPAVKAAFAKVDALIDDGCSAEAPEYRAAWVELEQAMDANRTIRHEEDR